MCPCDFGSPALFVFPDPKGSSAPLPRTEGKHKQSRKPTSAAEVSESCPPLWVTSREGQGSLVPRHRGPEDTEIAGGSGGNVSILLCRTQGGQERVGVGCEGIGSES